MIFPPSNFKRVWLKFICIYIYIYIYILHVERFSFFLSIKDSYLRLDRNFSLFRCPPITVCPIDISWFSSRQTLGKSSTDPNLALSRGKISNRFVFLILSSFCICASLNREILLRILILASLI